MQVERGLFSTLKDNIELFTIEHFDVHKPLGMRLAGYCKLHLRSADDHTTSIMLYGIPDLEAAGRPDARELAARAHAPSCHHVHRDVAAPPGRRWKSSRPSVSLLRRPRVSDEPAVFSRYASDPDVTRYMSFPTHQSLDDTHAFIQWSDAAVGAVAEGRSAPRVRARRRHAARRRRHRQRQRHRRADRLRAGARRLGTRLRHRGAAGQRRGGAGRGRAASRGGRARRSSAVVPRAREGRLRPRARAAGPAGATFPTCPRRRPATRRSTRCSL